MREFAGIRLFPFQAGWLCQTLLISHLSRSFCISNQTTSKEEDEKNHTIWIWERRRWRTCSFFEKYRKSSRPTWGIWNIQRWIHCGSGISPRNEKETKGTLKSQACKELNSNLCSKIAEIVKSTIIFGSPYVSEITQKSAFLMTSHW